MAEFRILGPLEVLDYDRSLKLGGHKQQALLVVLLLRRGEVLSPDRLIDQLWGERPPATAVKTLQVYISRLRKSLGDEALHTRGRGYVLTVAPGQLDLDEFERLATAGRHALADGNATRAAARLAAALDLWRGPPLADFTYDPFAQTEIARLEEARLAALEDRIEADLALGRHGRLVAELEALVREHPVRERLRGQLMLALYRAGRQADALDCYRDGRSALVNELGIEPGRELQELEAAILRHDRVLDPPTLIRASARAETRPEGPAGDASPTDAVVGREQQLDQLRNGLHAAQAGRPAVLMIGGEAGIGKTRLADEFAQEARNRGARVLWGRCWEAGGAPAYWPWMQVLRSLLDGADQVKRRAAQGAGARQLLALIADPQGPSPGPLSSSESEGARFQLFDAAARLLRESAHGEPALIILDDLHAADTPSLLMLQFLAGQLEEARVLVVGLYRDEEPIAEGLTACLAALAREPIARRMRLPGLDVVDTAGMITAIIRRDVPDSVAEAIHGWTEGNPLFVGEIVRLLEAEGRLEPQRDERSDGLKLPDTVREVIGQRIGRLPPESRELLSTASILGREFAIRELGAITNCEEDVVLERLEDAITARVLAEAPDAGRLRFSHALVRDTLYEALGATRRRVVHLRTGETLERVYASELDSHLTELAHHFFRALPSGDPGKAVEYARRAGDRAIALLAYEEAARLYSLALRALEQQGADSGARRCALLVALGDATARAGDEPAAKEAFLEAASIAQEAGLSILQAQAALGYGGRLVWSRAYNDVHLIPLLEAALRALPADASSLRVRVMARLSGALRDHLSRYRRSSLSAQAVQIARDLDDPATLAYALDGHYCAIMGPDNLVERTAIADEIVELARQVSDNERLAAGRLYRAIANMELGRMASVQAELETMASEAAELRQPAQMWVATASRANLALFQGRFADAEELAHEALTLGQRAQRRDAVLSHRLQLFVLDREVGGNPEIGALIAQSVSEFPTRPVFRCALAYIHTRNLDAGRARTAIDELAQSDFGAIQRDNEYLFSLGFAADAVCAQGDVSTAAVLYDLMAPFAAVNAANADEISTGSVSRTLGVLAAAMARWDDASHHFVAAIEHNREMGARPWLAHSYHDYGQTLLARGGTGDEKTAEEFLAMARGEYEALGMEPWAAQIARARTTAYSDP